MPTAPRLSRTPARLVLARWALTLLALAASLLGGAVPARAALPALPGPGASALARAGRRVAWQRTATAPSREAGTASLAASRATVGARPHHRAVHGAPHVAPRAAAAVEARWPSRPVLAPRAAGVPNPAHPAPSSRAPPIP